MAKLNVLIAGCTGYIGIELVKLLITHKRVNIKYLCGSTSVGKKISHFDKSIKGVNDHDSWVLAEDIAIALSNRG